MAEKQKLELTWIGKGEEPKLEPRILLYDKEKSYGDQNTENMLIHGDNLLALKALEQDYTGKVKCVYIDPPYNTGNAFEHYEDGIEHSLWLNMIKPRFELLWNLLDEKTGSFWVSIDDSEMPYLRVLMDELFGRDKFVACNVWQKRYSRENREAIGDVHEYIIVYAKDTKVFKEIRNLTPPDEKQKKVYRNPNNDPKGPWRPVPMTAQEGHATREQFYEITTPSGKIHTPPKGRCWGLSKATFEKLCSEGRIYFGKNGDAQPNVIRYLSEVDGFVPWTWWPSEEVGHTDEAKKEIYALFGKTNAFETPKPERLINRILHIATNPGDLVLDSFLGTGTTAAVAHKMGRNYIGIEMGKQCYKYCIPRLQKVVDGTDQGGISKTVKWQGGGGFKFYELAPSLLKKDKHGNWVIDKEHYNAEMLAAAVAKLNGYKYDPDEKTFWKQGKSHESSYIFTTTQFVSAKYLDMLASEMQEKERLLICCPAFDVGLNDRYENIIIKKIPQSVLDKCDFGVNNYNMSIIDTSDIECESDCDE
ncbi:site-specific DNA-methyltransferase [uncultured Clostridium sp.]|uniref:site-specific DNA-methyltransferase n=1 Tax=uncultured Clostridium sp. TaxID=59620 RepID=UPI0025E03FB6|nr:site-specific DNA-methyltransferase [uncultured Clostridium sp.]